ncbi:ras-like protein family member 10B [Rhagoletis pomonella]|uniref:ras-like protein family member 10B n=1 Tax=Rhagoletis pomonella TaxID=28610 RepID=UPI0017803EA4|nr:ras-like protein family member 10B [Rhagoletis pomonella]
MLNGGRDKMGLPNDYPDSSGPLEGGALPRDAQVSLGKFPAFVQEFAWRNASLTKKLTLKLTAVADDDDRDGDGDGDGISVAVAVGGVAVHSIMMLLPRSMIVAYPIIQFFYHDFPKTHQTTTRKKIYKSCLVCDTCIRELMVLDVPPQKRFPADNFAEWNNGHPLGLRTVHAYVLVFDMGNLETFQYCRAMREQILDSFSHRDFSIIVIGNKYDTVTEVLATSQELKDISTLVRKHWRCGYVECSAKYNYKIGDVFRELMGCTSTGAIVSEFTQSTRNKGRCTIL